MQIQNTLSWLLLLNIENYQYFSSHSNPIVETQQPLLSWGRGSTVRLTPPPKFNLRLDPHSYKNTSIHPTGRGYVLHCLLLSEAILTLFHFNLTWRMACDLDDVLLAAVGSEVLCLFPITSKSITCKKFQQMMTCKWWLELRPVVWVYSGWKWKREIGWKTSIWDKNKISVCPVCLH